MTEEELDTQLLANYMGWEIHPKYGENYLISKDKLRKLPYWCDVNTEGMLSQFDYSNSYDWLIPVLKKIQLTNKEPNEYKDSDTEAYYAYWTI